MALTSSHDRTPLDGAPLDHRSCDGRACDRPSGGPHVRRIAAASLVFGVAIILIAGRVAPIAAPPLYDGVVTIDPYRWLHPPSGQAGNPQGYSTNVKVEGGQSPLVAAGTPEQPPQAQIFAPPGGLTLPAGTTSLQVSITPVDPVTPPADGPVAGNVYRIVVATQSGVPVEAPASARVSVVIRGPSDLAQATVERFAGGTWQALKSESAGFGSSFVAVVTGFGDFALVAAGAAPSGGPSGEPTGQPVPTTIGSAGQTAPVGPLPSGGEGGVGSFLPLVVAAVAVVLLVGAALMSRRSSTPPPPVRRRRAPPKRRR